MKQEDSKQIFVYDRKTKELVPEIVLGDSLLKLAYHGSIQKAMHHILFKRAFLTKLIGKYCDSPLSKGKIKKTIQQLKIDTDEFADPVDSYKTFNEFFARKLKADARPFDTDEDVLCSPADARLTIYPRLEENLCIPVKGARFTVNELLGKTHEETSIFDGGVIMIFRLCPADYHRYHFPAKGKILDHWRIDGQLHSVNPVALKLGIKIFQHNTREVTMLELENFGRVAFVEVGAFGVGGIETTHSGETFEKMDEKGYFKFGGSTVILVFEPNKICIDHDLEERSARGIETLVRAGEHIADIAISDDENND